MKNEIMTPTPDCEIVHTRIVKAKKEHVFKAFTDPSHLKDWWGPKDFTNTFHAFELRSGGQWKYTMHGPQGDYLNEAVFIKISVPDVLIWNHVSHSLFQMAIVLDEMPDQTTKVTFKMIFTTPEECKQKKEFVLDKNEENLDRLEEELLKIK
ncbi:MAG: hypothetical protein K0R51_3281 [Cytophagaceae bacterium]|jgi:uncharacterized protein YndB with AHSA1/START domain|nr:hypothetical protein [Cytophagaceae bacterium]